MKFGLFFVSFWLAGVCFAVSTSRETDYLVVQVNEQRRLVKIDEELLVVTGDSVTIKEAVLNNPNEKVDSVNLVGYRNRAIKTGNLEDDRHQKVDTSRDLKRGYSHQKKGEIYNIIVKSGGIEKGKFRLKLVKPELRYAVVKINGNQTVLRSGDVIQAKASDTLKVDQVVTNLEKIDKDFTYRIVRRSVKKTVKGTKSFEIKFLRKNQPFAKISLDLTD